MTVDIDEVDSTAFVVACVRAMEKDRKHPLFEDPYAEWFMTERTRRLMAQVLDIFPAAEQMLRYRVRIFNEAVREAIADGVGQIVHLGAGFDMRAEIFRADGVAFYEVDQPAVLAHKHDVLARRGVTPCAAVPCDYLAVDLPALLVEAGLDSARPVLFVWEGNTLYLPADEIFRLLNELCAAFPTFAIVFDHLSGKLLDGASGNATAESRLNAARDDLGITFSSRFDDPGVFETRTPLRVRRADRILAAGERYAADHGEDLSEFHAENLDAIMESYSYCVLETR